MLPGGPVCLVDSPDSESGAFETSSASNVARTAAMQMLAPITSLIALLAGANCLEIASETNRSNGRSLILKWGDVQSAGGPMGPGDRSEDCRTGGGGQECGAVRRSVPLLVLHQRPSPPRCHTHRAIPQVPSAAAGPPTHTCGHTRLACRQPSGAACFVPATRCVSAYTLLYRYWSQFTKFVAARPPKHPLVGLQPPNRLTVAFLFPLQADRLLPYTDYRVGPLHALTVCFSGLAASRKAALAGLVVRAGGQHSSHLDRKCTHLVTLSTDSDKYR